MRAIDQPTESRAIPEGRLPSRRALSVFLGLPTAAWFSFASAAQAADFSPLPAPSTNVEVRGTPPAGGSAVSWSVSATGTNSLESVGTNALRAATNALPGGPSTGAQTRPLTPQEWAQRNFPEAANKPAGQARTLTNQLQGASQSTSSNLASGVLPAEAGTPVQGASQNTNSNVHAGKWAAPPPRSNRLTREANTTAQPSPSTATASNARGNTEATNALKAAFITSMEALDDKHRLAVGDKLSFRIVEDQQDPKLSSEPKPLVVADLGEIEVPYIGRFPAENKSCKQLANEIKAALEKDYYYEATVIIAVDLMTKSRGRVYLVGPVHVPGPQEVPSDEVLTLSKAIMRAGGFTDYADRQHVKVTRNGGKGEGDKQTFTVDVSQVLDKGKTDQDLPLQPGDLVVISERLIRF